MSARRLIDSPLSASRRSMSCSDHEVASHHAHLAHGHHLHAIEHAEHAAKKAAHLHSGH
jgi:hypothetical protein